MGFVLSHGWGFSIQECQSCFCGLNFWSASQKNDIGRQHRIDFLFRLKLFFISILAMSYVFSRHDFCVVQTVFRVAFFAEPILFKELATGRCERRTRGRQHMPHCLRFVRIAVFDVPEPLGCFVRDDLRRPCALELMPGQPRIAVKAGHDGWQFPRRR